MLFIDQFKFKYCILSSPVWALQYIAKGLVDCKFLELSNQLGFNASLTFTSQCPDVQSVKLMACHIYYVKGSNTIEAITPWLN